MDARFYFITNIYINYMNTKLSMHNYNVVIILMDFKVDDSIILILFVPRK